MSWNIAIMAVKAPKTEIENIMPDVMGKTAEGLFFEDATSVMMGKALAVSSYGDWIFIIDAEGRIIDNGSYAEEVSETFPVKTFWISEEMIFREYTNGFETKEIKGIDAGGKYLTDNGITPADQWGETRIIQILELETFPVNVNEKGWDVLFNLKFDKYEIG